MTRASHDLRILYSWTFSIYTALVLETLSELLQVSLAPLNWGWIVRFLVESVAIATEKLFGVKYQFTAEKRPISRMVC